MHETAYREPLTGLTGNYQSKAFSTKIAINPLIAAAAPLLSYAGQLQYVEYTDNDIEALLATLQYEVRAFESKAHKLGYSSQMILAARYLICALLDELMDPYIYSTPAEQNLLQTFQHESWGGERFFVILERSCEEANIHIDLLELGYICLSLGYQGKFAQQNQFKTLGLFIDQLYQIIEQQRGESSQHLLRKPTAVPTKRWALPPWWVTALASSVLLGLIFIPYQHNLNRSIQPLNTQIQQFEK